MVECFHCKQQYKNLQGLAYHLGKNKINLQEYYDKYIGERCLCPVCGGLTKFQNFVKGYSKYCSVSCSNKSQEHINSVKESNLKKYGVENVFQLEEVKQKSKDTLLKKTGYEHNSKNPTTIKRRKKIWIEKYGVDHPWKSKDIREKSDTTKTTRYGTKHPMQNKDIKEKQRNTVFEKYNVLNVSKNDKIIEKITQSNQKVFFNKLLNSNRLKEKCIPNFTLNEYKYVRSGQLYSWICTQCNQEFKDHIDNGRIPRCPICYPPSKTSQYDLQLYEYCKKYTDKVYLHSRFLLKDKEIDIYIPEAKFAIEFNGLYYHSERNGKNQDYHKEKTKRLLELDINLMHIFEDEWIEKKEIVKSVILSKMGKLPETVFARKCECRIISRDETYSFLNDNHLQGYIPGISVGLFYFDALLSVLVMGNPRFNKKYEWEILRFATKKFYSVPGGLSKLFSFFQKKFNPQTVITYADIRFGSGHSYKNLGFNYSHTSQPSFYYLDKKYTKRYNRMSFQKHMLESKLNVFDSSLSEWENMQLNGYDRIWDCGCNVFVWG